MRGAISLIFLTLLAGCTIRTPVPIKEMPKFGSGGKYSTTAGFLEGKWSLFIDESTARYHMPAYAKAIMAQASEELIFTSDGKVSFILGSSVAHGRWKESQNGIDLGFDDVNGIPKDKALAKKEKFMSGSQYYRQAHEGDYVRGTTLELANNMTKLVLHEDGKRLLQPVGSTRADGSTFMGSHTWIRAK